LLNGKLFLLITYKEEDLGELMGRLWPTRERRAEMV
jgi:hypothetical protein